MFLDELCAFACRSPSPWHRNIISHIRYHWKNVRRSLSETFYEPLISKNSLYALFPRSIRQSSVSCDYVKANYDVDDCIANISISEKFCFHIKCLSDHNAFS